MYYNGTALQGKKFCFTAMEWKFSDYIAEKMQRKFIKEMEIWDCFSLAIFRHLLTSINKFRGIQSCDTLNLKKSACLCNHCRLIANIPSKHFLILIRVFIVAVKHLNIGYQ